MPLTSILMYLAMREIWGWSLPVSIAVAGAFMTIDVAFVATNLVKVVDGGWAPLIIAACIFFHPPPPLPPPPLPPFNYQPLHPPFRPPSPPHPPLFPLSSITFYPLLPPPTSSPPSFP